MEQLDLAEYDIYSLSLKQAWWRLGGADAG